ncbi:MAG: cupin domain-containing protein [Proteobacteria bacterium]|nr:cupin domain-containing protein [Pseudomonadota bacterium]MBU1742256.1 cupin domain-containing protein [Pseudomonadota bacterium]
MLKVFNVVPGPDNPDGELILGRKQLETHACYLIYGVIEPGQTGRPVKPGVGHEEICLLARGEVEVVVDHDRYPLAAGHAFHLRGEESVTLENPGQEPAVYVIAGGHTPGSDHHH